MEKYLKYIFIILKYKYIYVIALPSKKIKADVAKLADASDLGSDAARRGGSSPSIRTTI